MNSDNVAGIEAQHKILDERIVSLCTNLKNQFGIDDLKDQLDDLVGFLQTHCEEEEKLMKRYGYNGLELHEREHQNLLNRVFSLREQIYASSEEQHKQALLEFLQTDLMEHVAEDVQTWQKGKIGREFVYRRLQDSALGSASSK